MSRETVTTLRCDLCGATSKPVSQATHSIVALPAGWGTGEWKRMVRDDASASHYEHLVLGLGVTPDFCPACMAEVEAVLIKRHQAKAR